MGLLLRAGVLVPERLVSSRRSALANANGATVLLALLFAAAQVFTMLTPEAGLMAILFNAFYLVLLWTTAAARPLARHLLRSLAVVFGSALVLRFVVLNGLAAPGGSFAHRLFTTALEGLTLGGLGLEYHAPATGYAAFVALGRVLRRFAAAAARRRCVGPHSVAGLGRGDRHEGAGSGQVEPPQGLGRRRGLTALRGGLNLPPASAGRPIRHHTRGTDARPYGPAV